ncbi:MAG TPA: hypothetical protein PLU92_08590, partial [Flexilinea sp.]|nr:hypothetical protein [Flexilinea sp.]
TSIFCPHPNPLPSGEGILYGTASSTSHLGFGWAREFLEVTASVTSRLDIINKFFGSMPSP